MKPRPLDHECHGTNRGARRGQKSPLKSKAAAGYCWNAEDTDAELRRGRGRRGRGGRSERGDVRRTRLKAKSTSNLSASSAFQRFDFRPLKSARARFMERARRCARKPHAGRRRRRSCEEDPEVRRQPEQLPGSSATSVIQQVPAQRRVAVESSRACCHQPGAASRTCRTRLRAGGRDWRRMSRSTTKSRRRWTPHATPAPACGPFSAATAAAS